MEVLIVFCNVKNAHNKRINIILIVISGIQITIINTVIRQKIV